MLFIRFTLLVSLFLPVHAAMSETLATSQATAAQDLLNLLDAGQEKVTSLPWQSKDRTEWSYFPWGHAGIPLSELNAQQRDAALGLLAAGLSPAGLHKAHQVMDLERQEAEQGLISRLWTDGEAYHTSIFGIPGQITPWSWRFEGHHLSVNLTLVGDGVISGTPYFIGADPALASTGKLKGLRILAQEETLARALFLSLNSDQRKRALIDDSAPRDILTGSESRAELPCCEGIPFTELNESQRGELLALLQTVASQLHPEVAAIHLARMQTASVEKLTFAWAGSDQQGQPHYYRIQGPTLLIEYDNTQNDANHIHLVLRDPQLDFGGDPLSDHYARQHSPVAPGE